MWSGSVSHTGQESCRHIQFYFGFCFVLEQTAAVSYLIRVALRLLEVGEFRRRLGSAPVRMVETWVKTLVVDVVLGRGEEVRGGGLGLGSKVRGRHLGLGYKVGGGSVGVREEG